MMDVDNVVGMVVSLVYVGAVLAASSLLARRGMSAEGSRKLVHIALGGWWIVAWVFFDSPVWAAALPALFIVVNAYAYHKQTLSFMAREAGEDTPGTVYYAVSLTILALFSFGIGMPYVGALGVFCMAFGDGFAAVLGKRFGRRTVPGMGGKTLVGSAVMFVASFASCAAVLVVAAVPMATAIAFVLAAAATALELASVDGLDNVAVPLGVTALYAVLFLPVAGYTPVLVGLLLSGVVALAVLRLRLLTVAGALGAVVVGTLAFAWGGWPLWILLMWFFGSSNIASKVMARMRGRARKLRGGARKLRQVLANSVPFLACALAYTLTGQPWLLIVAAGALAASTADTWASEIGVYSRKPPVNIVTRKPMQAGLSGGVSALGLVATVVGATITAFLALFLFHAFGVAVPTGPSAFLFIIACGVVGSVVDSFMGVVLQAKYRVLGEDDGMLVEASPRRGTADYTLVSGYSWVTNDAVNFMSGVAVVALGLLVVL